MSNQAHFVATTRDYDEVVTWIQALENLEKMKLCQVHYVLEKDRTTYNRKLAPAVAAGYIDASEYPDGDSVFIEYELSVWVDTWLDLEAETGIERARGEANRPGTEQTSPDQPDV